MRLLFVVHWEPFGTEDSIWTYTRILATSLAARGRHEVHILSCAEGQKRGDYVEQGIVIHCRRLARVPLFGQIRRILRMPRTLDRARFGISTLLEYRRLAIDFDVVEFPDADAAGWALAVLRPLPLVEQLHAPGPFIVRYGGKAPQVGIRWATFLERSAIRRANVVAARRAAARAIATVDIRWAAFLERFAIRRANVVAASSDAQVRAYRDVGWLRGRDAEIIPLATDWTNWWTTRPVAETKPVVLFAGRVVQDKAPEILVQAMSIVRRQIPEAEALFAGAVGQRDGVSYLDWIERNAGAVSGCRFLGHLSRQRLIEVMSESRVFVLPSWSESFGLVAVEAMSAGRPVVVTATSGGAAELVEKAGGGVIVPPGDAAALAEALLPFLADPGHAAAVGARATEVIRDRLDPEKIAARRELIYEKAIQLFKRGRAGIPARSH